LTEKEERGRGPIIFPNMVIFGVELPGEEPGNVLM